MEASYLKNFSYLFVPFTLEDSGQFPELYKKLTKENGWEAVPMENRYLHRYVLDKMSGSDDARRIGFRLDKDYAAERGLALGTKWYGLEAKKYRGEQNVTFDFMISDVRLFAFNTSICMLAFELRFREDDPRKIAAAQYYLRKISTEQIRLIAGDADGRTERFVDMSQRILADVAGDTKLDFFFYATPNNEKANFLTYIDVPAKQNYDEELFYLKWCYHDGFEYNSFADSEDSENYWASECILWGISVSAAVCLVSRSESQAAFIEKTFQKNFREQYLLTYVLLLHQKYMMYLFLTKLSSGLDGNLTQLERYKDQLYDFETHYMFSYISEVPQYQRFYKKVRNIFVLDELFRDVQEPLLQLTEIKKEKAEKTQHEYDYRINTALTTLSLLTIVSALTDATGITANLDWIIPSEVSRAIQLIALFGVAIVSLVMICRLIFLKKR